MSSSSTAPFDCPFSLQITTDGCCLNNGTSSASAGWGAVVVLSNHAGVQARAEVRSALCDTCDANNHTNNRAELRAAQFALRFIHELCKQGHPTQYCGYRLRGTRKSRYNTHPRNSVMDARPLEAGWVSAVIRSDSTFVINGLTGWNKPRKHLDVWEEVTNCKSCLARTIPISFQHVYGHSGDAQNERADALARIAATEETDMKTAACLDCDFVLDDYEELAAHFKSEHMQRDLEEEASIADHAERTKDGMYICPLCPRQLKNMFGVQRHLADKHGMR